MKRLRLFAVASAVLVLAALWVTRARAKSHSAGGAQLNAPCVSFVPREWGPYRGGSAQAGLAFEDNAGTLRFVTNLPCGATPVVVLEVRRPSAKSSGNEN